MIDAAMVKRVAAANGFALAGIAPVGPYVDHAKYMSWAERGLAGRMGYLTDHRADKRGDVRTLLPSARSGGVVGQLYNSPVPYSISFNDAERAWISRYAWGEDYHRTLRAGLERVVAAVAQTVRQAYRLLATAVAVLRTLGLSRV